MKPLVLFLFIFCSIAQLSSQEINARVIINSDRIPNSNRQVFQTLERDLTEFVNQKRWTTRNFKNQEKINCAFTITILEQKSSSEFSGTIQVQSVRPVYNSTYVTPVFNFKDDNLVFRYTEFENFQFDRNNFDSNLVSVMAYYVYTILAFDADSFEEYGGTIYFDEAENVMNVAQQSGYIGWLPSNSGVTRYRLMNELTSTAYFSFRESMYQYHRNGLDIMLDDTMEAKENIDAAIQKLITIYNRRPNSPLIRIFMDAKSDEIVNIFSGGPRYDANDLRDVLTRISASNASKWNAIK